MIKHQAVMRETATVTVYRCFYFCLQF